MYLTNNDDYSPQQPSAITNIVDVQDQLVNVYNLSGQLIRRNINRHEATQGLPAGMYVVGHKKVIVK